MDNQTITLIFFLLASAAFLVPGVMGFLTGEMKVSGRYQSTTYTGTKAAVMGFGYVIAGLMGLLMTVLIALKPTLITSQLMAIAVVIGLGAAGVAWLISWFVPGEAIREPRGWRLF